MAYTFGDSLYGIVLTLNDGTDTTRSKTISSLNSTDGAGRNDSAALMQRFAELLADCVSGNLVYASRNARQTITEVI